MGKITFIYKWDLIYTMKSGTRYTLLRVDGKGRVHVPAELREELGIEEQVLVKREKDSLTCV